MAAKMNSVSVFGLVWPVSEYICVPFKVEGGFKTCVNSKLDLSAGGSGKITRDGLALMGDGEGVLGGNWAGGAYGGAYGGLNGHYIGDEAATNAELGAALQPSVHTALGIDSKGQIPLAFKPSLAVLGNAGLDSNVLAGTGDDAKGIAQRLGSVCAKPAFTSK